jgi:biopolymer transport protein ExbB/TolQ
MPVRVDARVLDLVRRASTREASRVHRELSRPIYTLAIIAKTAAYVGILGACFAIFPILQGIAGDPRTFAPLYGKALGEALIPIAIGIAIALGAEWAYKFLTSRLEQFDLEMHAASLNLANSPSRLRFFTN